MNELSRRDLLVSILQALLLALFPWLRSAPKGIEAAKAGAKEIVTRSMPVSPDVFTESDIWKSGLWSLRVEINGYELSDEWMRLLVEQADRQAQVG